jgi:hypothetical protein
MEGVAIGGTNWLAVPFLSISIELRLVYCFLQCLDFGKYAIESGRLVIEHHGRHGTVVGAQVLMRASLGSSCNVPGCAVS